MYVVKYKIVLPKSYNTIVAEKRFVKKKILRLINVIII